MSGSASTSRASAIVCSCSGESRAPPSPTTVSRPWGRANAQSAPTRRSACSIAAGGASGTGIATLSRIVPTKVWTSCAIIATCARSRCSGRVVISCPVRAAGPFTIAGRYSITDPLSFTGPSSLTDESSITGQSSISCAEPLDGAASPAAIFASVDFPAPVVPTTATTSPGATVRSTPRRTWFCSPGRATWSS